jgi:hypothetical protein
VSQYQIPKSSRTYVNFVRGEITPIFEKFSNRCDIQIPPMSEIPSPSKVKVIEDLSEGDDTIETFQPDTNGGLQHSPEFKLLLINPLVKTMKIRRQVSANLKIRIICKKMIYVIIINKQN